MFREYLGRIKRKEVTPRDVSVFIGSGYSQTLLSSEETKEMESYLPKYREYLKKGELGEVFKSYVSLRR